MLIRHKITFWFIALSGLLVVFFSVYIYLTFESSREKSFKDRIKNKVDATKEIYEAHNVLAEKIINTIPEQSEYGFDENYNLIFAINDSKDFDFKNLPSIKRGSEYFFKYSSQRHPHPKEGVVKSFFINNKTIFFCCTAYDKPGFEQVDTLKRILIYGNIFILLIIGLVGHYFSINTLKPLNNLIGQINSMNPNDLKLRLNYKNPKDEIGIVTTSFNNLLEEIKKLIDTQKIFVAYASHELRTPLAAISGIMETSLKYDKTLEDTRKSLNEGNSAVRKLIGLTNGLLQLTRIESFDTKVEMLRINILELIMNILDEYKLKHSIQQFTLNVLPSLQERGSIEIMGNNQLLFNAIYNIIDNASKYSNHQRIIIELTDKNSGFLIISIEDRGIGIEDGDILNITTPLFRGKNTHGYEGVGIGLALTKRIVELHKGKIEFFKNIERGINVVLSFPFLKN
jgi:signal transduction histidine kinase